MKTLANFFEKIIPLQDSSILSFVNFLNNLGFVLLHPLIVIILFFLFNESSILLDIEYMYETGYSVNVLEIALPFLTVFVSYFVLTVNYRFIKILINKIRS